MEEHTSLEIDKAIEEILGRISAQAEILRDMRFDVLRLKRLVHEEEDRPTPVEAGPKVRLGRSPSQSAMQAFESSSDFLTGRKKPP